jgi:hypothetical protein
MKLRPEPEDAYLGMVIILLILVILLSLVMYTAFISPSYAFGQDAGAGMKRVADNLVVNDAIAGYADQSGMLGQVQVDNPRPTPSSLGAILLKIQLKSVRLIWQTGTGVDLSRAVVTFTGPAGTETLPGTTRAVLVKPCWKIAEKGSILPGQDDNGNDLLEPNEVFVLFIYPSVPLPPGTPFTLVVDVPEETPLVVSRVVPDPVTPVMDLG